MNRMMRASAVTLAALVALPSAARAACSEGELRKAADAYVEAQTTGKPALVAGAGPVRYIEQSAPAELAQGFLSAPQTIDFHRAFSDPSTCQAFVEAVVANPAHPYVIGTRLQVENGRVGEIETLVTDRDDWLFNAGNTMKYSRAERWEPIPVARRDSRATIIAAADAYLDLFSNPKSKVPWGSPCARLEGGAYTTKNAPGVVTAKDSCNVGVPSNTPLVNRRYIVDEAMGTAIVLLDFGKNKQPDSHMFRVEGGKLRYVHTITVCRTNNCGFPYKPIPDAPTG